MSKSVLISIAPKYCELVANGTKTIEIRKTEPKMDTPFKCYIYCTKPKKTVSCCGVTYFVDMLYVDHFSKMPTYGCTQFEDVLNGKVIGEFVCNNIDYLTTPDLFEGMDEISNSRIEEESCLSIDELLKYKGDKQEIYGWHISKLVIYDKPRELREFRKSGALSYDDWLYGMYNGKSESSYEKNLLPFVLTRPPQSWCYVESIDVNNVQVLEND